MEYRDGSALCCYLLPRHTHLRRREMNLPTGYRLGQLIVIPPCESDPHSIRRETKHFALIELMILSYFKISGKSLCKAEEMANIDTRPFLMFGYTTISTLATCPLKASHNGTDRAARNNAESYEAISICPCSVRNISSSFQGGLTSGVPRPVRPPRRPDNCLVRLGKARIRSVPAGVALSTVTRCFS
ncbi:hypothetical protein, variant [Exophiala oligosperma]|uniref:Uncharacterized protein n=1 Tax=Exophiala oligosperma TaxID=215243 RepID=A0A0D2E471_9EURO|nr:uncharacterized protein PV06_06116 [Exophiala oligosperma]XP_016262796.1 hypothetical protein, variant [Exophiala oligosperma]KIW42579.1 hypothetical protein PV06_06116 [Exophiala oligosperma]KIW42580.1 hypothetical protein, variant [Exophiala oligosperma]